MASEFCGSREYWRWRVKNGPVPSTGGNIWGPPPTHLSHWPSEDHRSRLVFIVEGIEPELIRRSFSVFNRLGAAKANSDPDKNRCSVSAPLTGERMLPIKAEFQRPRGRAQTINQGGRS